MSRRFGSSLISRDTYGSRDALNGVMWLGLCAARCGSLPDELLEVPDGQRVRTTAARASLWPDREARPAALVTSLFDPQGLGRVPARRLLAVRRPRLDHLGALSGLLRVAVLAVLAAATLHGLPLGIRGA